jgi:hypothetical protein
MGNQKYEQPGEEKSSSSQLVFFFFLGRRGWRSCVRDLDRK